MVPEARLEQREAGLTAVTEGWFVVNVSEGPWVTSEDFGDASIFEGDEAPFPQVGFTLGVLQPASRAGSTTTRPTRRTSSSSRASVCCSSRARSAG